MLLLTYELACSGDNEGMEIAGAGMGRDGGNVWVWGEDGDKKLPTCHSLKTMTLNIRCIKLKNFLMLLVLNFRGSNRKKVSGDR